MKTASVETKYQSTFMPIFQNAETRMKLAVLAAFLYLSSEYALRLKISQIIAEVQRKIPNVHDAHVYIAGLKRTANKYIMEFYRKPKRDFLSMDMEIKLPHEAFMKSQAKGSVAIQDYAKKLKLKMKQLAEMPSTTFAPGKKPISLWQKAELDVRYEHNLKMIEDLKAEGHDLCYISSHPDCSKRCEKWQGKLVSLTEHSQMSGFRVKKVDGKWVYSLPDITSQVDKYGYKNNIIVGFNCRHRLIPYHGQKPPVEYTKEDIQRQREVESLIREMERDIRKQLQYADELRVGGDKIGYKQAKGRADKMIGKYKAYCERNGYAWEKYRITV